ncbi:hypothetical protein SDC9_202728 [bioreactor metagenome]|uniref:Uncharacterized protein n=1 Tax=bioreactor metagenome TaxID=1076179 RepID=A0A645IX83_9ZZZZ
MYDKEFGENGLGNFAAIGLAAATKKAEDKLSN